MGGTQVVYISLVFHHVLNSVCCMSCLLVLRFPLVFQRSNENFRSIGVLGDLLVINTSLNCSKLIYKLSH